MIEAEDSKDVDPELSSTSIIASKPGPQQLQLKSLGHCSTGLPNQITILHWWRRGVLYDGEELGVTAHTPELRWP